MKYRIIILVVVFGIVSSFKKPSANLSVDISGLRSNDGNVLVALYDNADKFPLDAEKYAVGKKRVTITNKTARINFDGLKPGRYAISILHDENNNLKMDFNILGIPREGFGFSNNAKGTFGPPSYKKASFEVGEAGSSIKVRMRYM